MKVVGIHTTSGEIQLQLKSGETTLIAGPNGVGKSALLYQLYRGIGQGMSTYFPGHRQINLNQSVEIAGQDFIQLQQNSYNSYDSFNRYKGAWAEDQFKSIIRKLLNMENAFNREFRERNINSRAPIRDYEKSPLDKLNFIFNRSGLLVKFELTGLGLTAFRFGHKYSVEALSDGERAALFIAAGILVQDQGLALLIDEPEKHLHPSITSLLIESAISFKDDIPIIICSHDISLIDKLRVDKTIYVKNSQVVSLKPENRVFDLEILNYGEVPDQLRIDVLGAREKILYIEGTNESRDAALYSSVFVGWKVLSRGSSQAVIESTRGVRNAQSLHWIEAIGLVDGDGRDAQEKTKLALQRIYTLPFPAIENLFFLEEAQRCFVNADIAMRGGASWAERRRAMRAAIKKVIATGIDNIAARRAVWLAERQLNSNNLSVNNVKNGNCLKIEVDVADLMTQSRLQIGNMIKDKNVDNLLKVLPIKTTDIPDVLSRALGARSFKDYCSVVQKQVDIGNGDGVRLISAVKNLLPQIG